MSCIRLALLGMALAACRGAAAQPPPAQVPPIAVRTAVALEDHLSDEVELPGTLQAERRAALSVLAPGRVESVTVQRGDAVRAGDVLLRLREVDPRRQVLAAAAALEALRVRAPRDPERAPEVVAARTAWDQADDAFSRTEQLRAAGSVSAQEVVRVRLARDAARAQWSSAVASARAAQASARQAEVAVAQSRQGLQDAVLRAPFDGVVAAREVEPGEWVSPERPVLQLVDARTLRVRVEVPQNLAAQPVEGLRVWFDPEGAVQREASLRWRAPALDPATRARALEASLDAPEGALPGQRVLVRWRAGATRQAARVPVDALRGDGPTATVFAVRDGRAEARVVHVPHRRDGWAVVADGLAPGSVVVRDPLRRCAMDRRCGREGAAARGCAVRDVRGRGAVGRVGGGAAGAVVQPIAGGRGGVAAGRRVGARRRALGARARPRDLGALHPPLLGARALSRVHLRAPRAPAGVL